MANSSKVQVIHHLFIELMPLLLCTGNLTHVEFGTITFEIENTTQLIPLFLCLFLRSGKKVFLHFFNIIFTFVLQVGIVVV
jgi:hypothetical protein